MRDQIFLFFFFHHRKEYRSSQRKKRGRLVSFNERFVNFLDSISLEDDLRWPQKIERPKRKQALQAVRLKRCGHLRMRLLTYLLMCNSLIRNPRIRQGVSSFVSTGSFSSPRGKLARTRTHARANTHESRLFSPLFLREKKEKRKKGYRGFYDRSILCEFSKKDDETGWTLEDRKLEYGFGGISIKIERGQGRGARLIQHLRRDIGN